MDGFRALWQHTRERLAQATSSPISAARNPAVEAYLDEVLATFPYTDTAKAWFHSAITFEVENLDSTSTRANKTVFRSANASWRACRSCAGSIKGAASIQHRKTPCEGEAV
jgi:hypothetical protein